MQFVLFCKTRCFQVYNVYSWDKYRNVRDIALYTHVCHTEWITCWTVFENDFATNKQQWSSCVRSGGNLRTRAVGENSLFWLIFFRSARTGNNLRFFFVNSSTCRRLKMLCVFMREESHLRWIVIAVNRIGCIRYRFDRNNNKDLFYYLIL